MLNFEEIFGFNPKEKVYPDEYAIEEEKVPKWLSEWINEDDKKQEFLFKQFRLNTKYSPVVELRMHFVGKERLEKKVYERYVDELHEKLPKKLLDTIWWLSKNKNKIKYIIKREVVE